MNSKQTDNTLSIAWSVFVAVLVVVLSAVTGCYVPAPRDRDERR